MMQSRQISVRWFVYFTLVLPLILLVTTKMADVLIGPLPSYEVAPGFKRHIVLREHPPNSHLRLSPDAPGDTQNRSIDMEIDENGFIKPSAVNSKADVNIVFLGGSTTECLMMESHDRFPYLVGRLLEVDGRKVNTFNGGVSGNTTMHALNMFLNKVVPMSPQFVVMMETINDVSVLVYERTYWNTNPTRRLVAVDAREGLSSATKQLLREAFPNTSARLRGLVNRYSEVATNDEWAHVRGVKVDVDFESARSQFRQSLLSFVRLARIYSITPILMTQARRRSDVTNLNGLGDRESQLIQAQERLFNDFTEIIRDVARSESVVLIDLNADVPWSGQNFYDGIHYTRRGSQVVAERIANVFQALLARDLANAEPSGVSNRRSSVDD